MTTPVAAIYEGGVFKPLHPLRLAELTEVEVLIPVPVTDPLQQAGIDATTMSMIDDLIGFIHDAPADMAEKHDLYLSGKA